MVELMKSTGNNKLIDNFNVVSFLDFTVTI